MTEKEAILRDLKVIAILDQKIDYSDRDNIEAVLSLDPKQLFSTEYGARYLERIRHMYNGEPYDHTCILCGAPIDGNAPICDNCYKMITIGTAKKPEVPKHEEPEPAKEETPVQAPVSYEERLAADRAASGDTQEYQPEPPSEKEDDFSEDAREVQQTYDEISQDAVDPKARGVRVGRVLVLIFVVICFSVGIVSGLAFMIGRNGDAPHEQGKVEQQIVYDTDSDMEDI